MITKGVFKMARKYMTKEVTFTTAKIAKMEIGENGLPVAVPVDDIIFMGNVTKEKAQKLVNKVIDGSTVYSVETATQTYRMKVTDFINSELSELVLDGDNNDDEEEEDEE
jgi:Ran GTPase-activating protein (RanGAP) involved in mRNA processing and transport